MLDRCWELFDGGNETWVTVFAEKFDVNLGCCCGGFTSSGKAGVGDKEGSSEDDDEGVERGVVKVDEGDDGDEILEDVNVEEIEAGVIELLSKEVVIPNPWGLKGTGTGAETGAATGVVDIGGRWATGCICLPS